MMNLQQVQVSLFDELTKIAGELTEAAREHIAKKNFAVSAKASNTGKPAYPIEDKAHARAALGFAAMHHDKKDLAEVKKDVEAKYPGMVHDKVAFIAPLSLVTGTIGYLNGRNDASEGRAAPTVNGINVASGLIIPPYGTYQIGKHLGHAQGTFIKHKEKNKTAGMNPKAVKAASAYLKAASFGEQAADIAGLGVLAVPSIDTLQAKLRGGKDWEKKKFIGEGGHAAMELGGLGVLAADSIHKAMK